MNVHLLIKQFDTRISFTNPMKASRTIQLEVYDHLQKITELINYRKQELCKLLNDESGSANEN